MKALKLLLASMICIGSAHASVIKTYIGLETGIRYMDFKGGYGKDYLPKSSPQFGLHGGIRVADNFGVELGTHLALPKKRQNTKMRLHGYHASLLVFYPIFNNIEVLGGIGANHLIMKLSDLNSSLKFSNVVPRFTGGIQYSFNDWLSSRLSFIWKGTRDIKNLDIKAKNAIHTTLGLNVTF